MDTKVKLLNDLLKISGNLNCADCGVKDVTHASYNIGVFLCQTCAGIHTLLGSHISKTKHLKLDHWELSQINRLKDVGNAKAKLKYEARVPINWRRPIPSARDTLLLEHWINAKYAREEFIQGKQPPPYSQGLMEGHMYKRARENNNYYPRKFVLDGKQLRYYVKETKSPKAIISLQHISLFINPAKMQDLGFPCMQIDHIVNGSTRHIFVYHEDAEVIGQWYQSIMISKLNQYKSIDSSVEESPVQQLQEGWLWKAGPVPTYTHRKRWFTLDNRKLMYHLDAFDAYPKGEIFVGDASSGGYKLQDRGFGEQSHGRCSFSLHTPYRTFILSSETEQDKHSWVNAIGEVLRRPLTQQDKELQSVLVKKRSTASNPLNNLLSRS
jgi:hypothetical protein